MKARTIQCILISIFLGFSFSVLLSQSAESGPETKIHEMLLEAESLQNSDPDNSLKTLRLALSMAEEGGFEGLKAEIESKLAKAFMTKGYYSTALNSGFNALRYYDSIGDASSMGKVKHRIATIYLETENTELSLQYDTEALGLLNPEKDSLAIAWTYLGLGNYMSHMKKRDSALYYYSVSLDLATQVKHEHLTYCCYNNIANTHKNKGEFETALNFYLKGIEITKRNHSYSSTAFTLDNVGALYFSMGNPMEALKYSEEAYGMAIEHQSASGLVNIHSNLAKAYEATGNCNQAFKHQKAYTELIESYFNEKISSSMADMEGKYQIEKKQAEITLLHQENEFKAIEIGRQKTLRNLMVGGLALLLVFVIIVVLAYRDKQKTNRLLHAQQEEIKRINTGLEVKVKERTEALASVNTELNDLLYRTSHDLRTPITKIMGLVELAKIEAMPPETVLEYIDGTMEMLNQQNLSICELGIIRQRDLVPANLDLRNELEAVASDLKESSQLKSTEIDFDVATGIACTVDPYLFKLAVKEVIANAISFGNSANVLISGKKEGNRLRLEVKDHGPGVPSEIKGSLFDLFVKGTHTPGHFGLGLYKARLAVERMGGVIDYRSVAGEGTVFSIELNC